MTFATDRDLLILEPNLFRDVLYAGQRLASGADAAISGTSLTSATAAFDLAQVTTGHIVLVNELPLEVISRVSGTELDVSLMRAARDGASLPPPPGTGMAYEIATFGPQIEIVHRQIMRLADLDPDDIESGDPSELDVVNLDELTMLESLGALDLVLSGATALVGERGSLWSKAQIYRNRFQAARERTRVRIDLDGDGIGEVVRHLSVAKFIRA